MSAPLYDATTPDTDCINCGRPLRDHHDRPGEPTPYCTKTVTGADHRPTRVVLSSRFEAALVPRTDWIQTYTGRQFFPLAPSPEMFDPRDVAHHLAHICRFTGGVDRWYSVAQHSVLVSGRAAALADKACGDPERILMVARWGLVHDLSEAYLADIARPVKKTPTMGPYRDAEKRIQEVAVDWLGLPREEPWEVDQADKEVCYTEARDLLGPKHPAWAWNYEPLPQRIHPLGPWRARRLFRSAWAHLFPEQTPAFWTRQPTRLDRMFSAGHRRRAGVK